MKPEIDNELISSLNMNVKNKNLSVEIVISSVSANWL